jgi:hypothetical protein
MYIRQEIRVMKRQIRTTITVTNDSWRETMQVAEQIADKLGYEVGPMQRDEPRAMFKEIDGVDVVVAKWRNLSLAEREQADGVMVMDAGGCSIEIQIREPLREPVRFDPGEEIDITGGMRSEDWIRQQRD